MKQLLCSLLFIFCSALAFSQEESMKKLPYHQIPDYPEVFESGNVAARMVDGLGYRYYWVTKDLRQEDLDYKPSEDGRSTKETLDHLFGLSKMIMNTTLKKANSRGEEKEMTWEEKRAATLNNFKTASDHLKGKTSEDLQALDIIFKRGDQESRVPFWNLLNGPIADAIYHCGQIVAFRRASGNPQHPGVNVFMGKTKE